MTSKTIKRLPCVSVLMASYNGEKYIAEQIDSILAQSNVQVHLTICDDGSIDNTIAICEQYANNYNNIDFFRNSKNKGVAENFMDMVYGSNASEYDFFAFSDQDDYWMPEKIEKAIKKIDEQGGGPWLYYSDVCNTDASLNGCKYEYAAFSSVEKSIKALLLTNWASGCTMVFNREFCLKLQEFHPRRWPRIHDSWVHLVALSCCWVVPDLEHSYIKRRITGDNTVGERGFGVVGFSRIRAMFDYLFSKSTHFSTYSAEDVLEGYSQYMTTENRTIIANFAKCRTSILARLLAILDSGYSLPYSKENALIKGKIFFNKY